MPVSRCFTSISIYLAADKRICRLVSFALSRSGAREPYPHHRHRACSFLNGRHQTEIAESEWQLPTLPGEFTKRVGFPRYASEKATLRKKLRFGKRRATR